MACIAARFVEDDQYAGRRYGARHGVGELLRPHIQHGRCGAENESVSNYHRSTRVPAEGFLQNERKNPQSTYADLMARQQQEPYANQGSTDERGEKAAHVADPKSERRRDRQNHDQEIGRDRLHDKGLAHRSASEPQEGDVQQSEQDADRHGNDIG